MACSRILDFSLECKILEHGPDLEAAIASEDMSVSQTEPPRKQARSMSRSEKEEVASASSSRVSNALDLSMDTIVCRVMFVYFSNGIHYKKCTLEMRQDCTLHEMLRAVAAKAGVPAQKCRVFSCNKVWGNMNEVDLHSNGYASLMNFPVGKSQKLNFIVDYVNTVPEENRPTPFELNEIMITTDSVQIE